MIKYANAISEIMPAKDDKKASFKDEILCDVRLMNELHALGFEEEEIDEYLPTLVTYLEQRDAEEDPKHEKIAPFPNMKMTLMVDDSGRLSFMIGPSDESKNRQLIEENYIYRDYPDEWVGLRPAAFKKGLFKEAKQALGNALKEGGKRWVFIHGESGSEESKICAAYANQLALSGKIVCFLDSNTRFDDLKNLAIKDRSAFEQRINSIKSCKLLVIDDFGNGFKSEYIRDQILMPILNERSKKGLNTYFTSQFSLSEIEQLYAGRGNRIEGKKVKDIIFRNIIGEIVLGESFAD